MVTALISGFLYQKMKFKPMFYCYFYKLLINKSQPLQLEKLYSTILSTYDTRPTTLRNRLPYKA